MHAVAVLSATLEIFIPFLCNFYHHLANGVYFYPIVYAALRFSAGPASFRAYNIA